MSVKEKIATLEDMFYQREFLKREKKKLLDSIIPKEIQDAINEIEAEFDEKTDMLEHNITRLSSEIKEEVKGLGSSIKGEKIHAVFVKGRTTWDTNKLEALSIVVPQIEEAKKVGEPTVSIKEL